MVLNISKFEFYLAFEGACMHQVGARASKQSKPLAAQKRTSASQRHNSESSKGKTSAVQPPAAKRKKPASKESLVSIAYVHAYIHA
jgi:hypothetical protein